MTYNQDVPNVNELDIGNLLAKLIEHKKLIACITGIFVIIATIYTFLATPIYQADALIQVEQAQGNTLLNSFKQMLPDASQDSAPEVELLRSRMIIGKTVEDLNSQR